MKSGNINNYLFIYLTHLSYQKNQKEKQKKGIIYSSALSLSLWSNNKTL